MNIKKAGIFPAFSLYIISLDFMDMNLRTPVAPQNIAGQYLRFRIWHMNPKSQTALIDLNDEYRGFLGQAFLIKVKITFFLSFWNNSALHPLVPRLSTPKENDNG